MEKEIKPNSLIRTGTTIQKYSEINEFNLFITIRYKKNVSKDIETLQKINNDKIFKTLHRRIKQNKNSKGIEKDDFKALLIYELNNDLKHYHCHIMLNYPYKIKNLEKTIGKLIKAIATYGNGAVAVKSSGSVDIKIEPITNQKELTRYLCKTFNEKKIYRYFQCKRRKYDGIPYSAYVAALKGNKHRFTQINCKTPPTSKLYHSNN